MKEYIRENPLFSLCGLNCGLCPRYNTNGKSKCPGCGGKDFHIQHPSCAVITCSKKHGDVKYCFQCEDFPCPRYELSGHKDSFITYKNVLCDMEKARSVGIERYQQELDEKISILEYLLAHYDNGRRKNFYCLAVNLFELSDLKELKEHISCTIEKGNATAENKVEQVVSYILECAKSKGLDLKLRK